MADHPEGIPAISRGLSAAIPPGHMPITADPKGIAALTQVFRAKPD